jgi:hypothetical protein
MPHTCRSRRRPGSAQLAGEWTSGDIPRPRTCVVRELHNSRKDPSLDCYWGTLFKRRDSAHIRDDGMEIGFRRAAELHLAGYRWLKGTSVARYFLSKRPIDLRIGPFADP